MFAPVKRKTLTGPLEPKFHACHILICLPSQLCPLARSNLPCFSLDAPSAPERKTQPNPITPAKNLPNQSARKALSPKAKPLNEEGKY